MATITVKLDKKRASRVARWARARKTTKSEVIRTLIDQAGPIETGDDLAELVAASKGKGLGLAQKKP
jgi:predicted transcriptional regulator